MKSEAVKFNKPAPLSKNQLSYIKRSLNSWLNVAEGGWLGKRGGKNVLQTLAFCISLETHEDRLHLVSGVSVATALLNVVDCDGYGVTNYFSGRCKYGKFNERNCLYVTTKTGEKIILISGGGKLGDEKAIKGQTFGMAYITDAGFCGSADSVIGMEYSTSLKRLSTSLPERYEIAESGLAQLNGVEVLIDSAKATQIKRINFLVDNNEQERKADLDSGG